MDLGGPRPHYGALHSVAPTSRPDPGRLSLDPGPHRPLRVGMVTAEYPPMHGGVGDYTAILSQHLALLGAKVVVITGGIDPSPSNRQVVQEGPEIVRAIARWDFRILRQVPALARRLELDLVHIQYQAGAYALHPAVHLLPLALRLAGRPSRLPAVVTTFHDLRVPYLFPKAGPLRQAANRVLLHWSDAAIFTDREDLLRAGPGQGRHWVPIGSNIAPCPPPGFDRNATRASLGADEGTLLIGYFGFLNSSKGVPVLLEAVRRLVDDGRRAVLLLVGGEAGDSDPTDRAEGQAVGRRIAELALERVVRRTGYLDAPRVAAHLLACDLCVLPFLDGASLRRGTLMAALAHGLPVVSTRRPGYRPDPDSPWELRDGENILLADPGDPASLARAILQVADSPHLRHRLAHGALELSAHLTWPKIAEATWEVYRQTAIRWPPSSPGPEARGG